jgi:hypothetical protein
VAGVIGHDHKTQHGSTFNVHILDFRCRDVEAIARSIHDSANHRTFTL